MITFSIMSRTRFMLAVLAAAITLPGAAKSPEEFVGPAPADSAKRASPPKTAPAPAAKPASKPAAKASLASPAAPDSTKPASAKAAGVPKPAAKGAKPALDTARVHSLYLDGDFDQAIRLLDNALRGRKPLTHADSVFAFKHLGVMYAATPATREKGRYYMLQLISIEPTARILDMYASDMIYLIFRNVQEEYENKRGKTAVAAPVDTTPAPLAAAPKDTLPAPAPAARPAPSRNRALYWVAGGAAITAGAAGLLFILLDNPQPKKRNIALSE
jgi:hypothetical protein